MGRAIAARINDYDRFELAGVWTRGDEFDDLSDLVASSDAVIDFSLPDGTASVLKAVVARDKPLVCGVSGLDVEQMDALRRAAETVPLVYDRNMSQGISLLNDMVRRVAKSLGPNFAVSIEETHHIHKKDAPSGTALKLGETVVSVRDLSEQDIHYVVERQGEVPGDHAVIFESPAERIVLSHSVTTRDVFAEGALRAAEWVVAQPAGLFSMRDVLFTED